MGMRCRSATGVIRIGVLAVLLAIGCASRGTSVDVPPVANTPIRLHPEVTTVDCSRGPTEAEEFPQVTEFADGGLRIRFWEMHSGTTIDAENVHASMTADVLRIDYTVTYPPYVAGGPTDMCPRFSRLDLRLDDLPRRPASIEVFSALVPDLPVFQLDRGPDGWPASIPH
jgi:hypothetical protein